MVRVRYTDLDNVHSVTPINVVVDTDVGSGREMYIAWDGSAQQAHVSVGTGEGSGVDCRAASADVDFEKNTATLRVPRSCLGVPRWVRVCVESVNYTADPYEADNAMDAGFPATSHDRTFTDRIYPGAGPSPTESGSNATGATTLVLPDPRGDVASIGEEANDFYDATPAPQQKHGDIVSTTVEHTATLLRIRVEFAHLAQDPSVDGYRLDATVKTDAGTWTVEDDLEGSPMPYAGMLDERLPCDGLDHEIDDGVGVVTMSIPRTCLVDPEWVRLSLHIITFQDAGAVWTIDDALVKGYGGNTDRLTRPIFTP